MLFFEIFLMDHSNTFKLWQAIVIETSSGFFSAICQVNLHQKIQHMMEDDDLLIVLVLELISVLPCLFSDCP